MAAKTPIRILSISDDDGLRISREMLLAQEGYETTSATSSEALTIGSFLRFDLVLICTTVPVKKANRIKARLRQLRPEIGVLEISPTVRDIPPYAFDLDVNPAPGRLLDAVRRMSGRNSRVH